MSVRKYNDLEILFLHIDNHTKYLKHKQKLKNIKPTVTKLMDPKEYNRSRRVFETSKKLNRSFNFANKNNKEEQDNFKIRNKLVSILNRDYVSTGYS